jgi:hypothetical protein
VAQRDWGWGPTVDGRRIQLWCAWLAWSRFRVVIPVVGAVRYSVPHTLIDQSVWIRFHGHDLIVTAMVNRQPVEVA